MKETIDLYAKMVIGTFSFIGPSFTLLIPLFYTAIERSTAKHRNMLKNLQVIATQLVDESENLVGEYKKRRKEIDKLIRSNERELNLLNPRRQVRRLFISLFCALFFIFFYYFQHSHFWKFDSQNLRIICIGLSVVSFVYCITVLWQVFCTIIRIKSEDEKRKKPGVSLGRAA